MPSTSCSTPWRKSAQGQDRGDKSYSSFCVFRLSERAVLSLDWPKKMEEDDEYISVARRLL